MLKKIYFLFFIFFLSILPSNSWGFVTHEYPAIYTHQLGNAFYLIASLLFLWTILKNRLQKEPGWRYLYLAVIFFIIWDLVVLTSRFAEAWWIEPSQTIGGKAGWQYFTRQITIEGLEYIYYLGRFDFIVLNIAMLFFYMGLREHLKGEEKTDTLSTAALLPLLPILLTEITGNIVFIVLGIMSLVTSIKLYRKDKENILWNYMVWLSASYVMFSFSRSFGHVLKHILIPTENQHIWAYLEGITGSLNTAIRFLFTALTLFFIWVYRIYLKMSRDREKIDIINLDLTELNREIETLVAERTMTLMGLTVADKVRNPTFLIGFACKRILEKEQLSDKMSGQIRDIIDQCNKLEGIVGDFESILKSRKTVFKYEDINAIVADIASTMEKEAANAEITLATNLSKQPLKINLQKNLLKAALFHIMRNAIEATPRGGKVKITTSQVGDNVILAVSDTGLGIKKEDIEKIFDPFFSTKQYRFGMGLPLVKQIVSEHLGEINVESEMDIGTTFEITFPIRWKEEEMQALIAVEPYEKFEELWGHGLYSVNDIENILKQYLSEKAAEDVIENFMLEKNMNRDELTSSELLELRNIAQKALASAIGAPMASCVFGSKPGFALQEKEEISESLKHIVDRLKESHQELAQINKELSHVKEFNENIIESAPIGIATIDSQLLIKYWNREMETITGIQRQDAFERSIKLLLPWIEENMFMHNEQKEILLQSPAHQTFKLKVNPFKDPSGGVVIILEDITETQRLERERKNILSMFAHDMKNPILTAGGFLLRILSGKAGLLTEKQLEYYGLINEELKKLQELITDFLEFSRFEAKECKPVKSQLDITEAIKKHFEITKMEADKKNIQVNFELAENIPIINADPIMIERVLTNLLDNAIKYTNPGGAITVRLLDRDNEILVQVADTGIGIPANHLPYIFDAFYRVSRDSRGSGLGLSISKTIIDAHGGKIWVESTLGAGSAFSFTLPRY
ncbi:MAG: hypothetical protein C0415_04750 [Thermodesulfovibrio sp.]|nr:hypothetical protein [Thermodesulfovibrio sp.]